MLNSCDSGEYYNTFYGPLENPDLAQCSKEWNFDWKKELSAPNRQVFKLCVVGSDEIQGLISLEIREGYVFINLVESAPWNVGSKTKKFIGVGAHLFAISCKISFELQFDGVVSYFSKSNLIDHYESSLGAKRLGSGLQMAIDTTAATKLVEQYFKKE